MNSEIAARLPPSFDGALEEAATEPAWPFGTAPNFSSVFVRICMRVCMRVCMCVCMCVRRERRGASRWRAGEEGGGPGVHQVLVSRKAVK